MNKPSMSLKEIENKLQKFKKVSYNPYRWWRMYEHSFKPLGKRKPLIDKIKNGDFDIGPYLLQVNWCKHKLYKIYKKYSDDPGRATEESSILRARIKKLEEDYHKDEKQKLNDLIYYCNKEFQFLTEKIIKEEMIKYSGNTINFYYYLKELNINKLFPS